MNNARCRHCQSITHRRCMANHAYVDVRQSVPGGPRALFPCFAECDTCQDYSPYTAEELAAQEEQVKRATRLIDQGLSPCCEAPIDCSRVITTGSHKGHGPRLCSKCSGLVYQV